MAISKIAPLLLAALLLLPFIIIFWRMTRYQPQTEEEIRARLQKVLDGTPELKGWQPSEPGSGEGLVMQGVAVSSVEAIGFSSGTMRWLRFYPRQWVGLVGLLAVTVLLALVGFSTWFRSGPLIQLSKNQTFLSPLPEPDAPKGSWGSKEVFDVPRKDQGKKE